MAFCGTRGRLPSPKGFERVLLVQAPDTIASNSECAIVWNMLRSG
jgi:hypothetical protein